MIIEDIKHTVLNLAVHFSNSQNRKKHVHAAYIFSNRDKIYFFKPTDFPSFAK